jgi:hypothetical protein
MPGQFGPAWSLYFVQVSCRNENLNALSGSLNIVLVGSFNTAIFDPEWFVR